MSRKVIRKKLYIIRNAVNTMRAGVIVPLVREVCDALTKSSSLGSQQVVV